jgi:aminopeptidase
MFVMEKNMSQPYDMELLEKYADVAVGVGVNLQKGQRLWLNVPIEARELGQAIVRSAYKRGASFVQVNWQDPITQRIRMEECDEDYLDVVPEYMIEALSAHMDAGYPILNVRGVDPELMKGIDPKRLQKVQMATGKASEPVAKRTTSFKSAWCVIAVPVPAWTAKVFPDLSPEEGERAMWDVIFDVCRIKEDDPVEAWRKHSDELNKRADYLTNKGYTALHYKGEGTDLRVGLPKGHLWKGGGQMTQSDVMCVPNIPTEEIFTLPHKDQIEGVVSATKPLPYAGNVIDNFKLQFSEGVAVHAEAQQGQEALDMLLSMDDGAKSLGELALVPHSSPISQSGKLFFNVLYDENAACHVALGRAYTFTIEGGNDMSAEELDEAGVNVSITHNDFMIGSESLNIDGITADGKAEPILRNGEWAFEV